MQTMCPQCGAPAAPGQSFCEYCGATITGAQVQPEYTQPQTYQSPQSQVYQPPQPQVYQSPQPQAYQPQHYQSQQPVYGQPYGQRPMNPAISMYWPVKNKVVAGILAIFFGWIGVHDFYLGRTGSGILKLIFSWTGIPAIIAFIEGIIILASNDENFQLKYHCRLR